LAQRGRARGWQSRSRSVRRSHPDRVDSFEVWLVSSISLPLRPKSRNGLVLAPWSGAPNQSMVGGPLSHSAIKRGWGPRLAVRGSPRRHISHPTNPNPTEGALERREAPPLLPPRPSSWIRRTQCHRPTLDRIVRDTVAPEPALLPLRQAAAAPATTTCKMASDSALPSNPYGLRPFVSPSVLYIQ
jgi:hypothetical protein